jgi:acetoin utilization protein AcuC
MPEPLAFIYHDVYDGRGFSRLSDSWRRYALARALLREVGLLPLPGAAEAAGPLAEFRPTEATDADILAVHSPEHLAHVKAGDERGTGFLDYGDTPAWSGVLRRAKLAVGGTLLAARLVAGGTVRRAFNPAGGLHHAQCDRAAGFCPFNDLVIAVRALQREHGIERIAIVDLDGHHGDGTEALLYDEPVLTISMHRYDGRFYPGTGAAGAVGRGPGFGFNLNLPLDRGTRGPAYLATFDRWVAPAVRDYRPEIILVQVGADSHFADPLVRLGLALPDFRALAARLAALADELCGGRLIAVAGGGYAPEHVARVWAVYLATLSGGWPEGDSRLAALYAQEDADNAS